MVRLELDDEQCSALAEVLEEYVSDLRIEIGHTERKNYRDEIKRRKEVLDRILGAVRREPVQS